MQPGLKDIPLNGGVVISTTVLAKANQESIRLGFSRNLHGIDGLPTDWVYPIESAFVHTSMDNLQNIRLMIPLPVKIGSVKKAAHSLVRRHMSLEKLRFLLYPSGLTDQDQKMIRKDNAGVIWL